MKVTKAIIPAAGRGTRLLPASKAVPKEMLPIVDKPGIQYIIEELVAAKIEEIVLITGQGKGCIEDHFDINQELEEVLEKGGRKELLRTVRKLSRMVTLSSVRQKQQLGTGDAVLCAAPVAGENPVAVLFPDDLIDSGIPATKQLLEVADRYNCGVIAIREVPEEDTPLYGIIEAEQVEDRLFLVKNIVEKPPAGTAPSNLAVIGRYILPPDIFPILRDLRPSEDGEVQLAEGLVALSRRQKLYGYCFSGIRYDVGDKLGFVQATVGYALKHPDLHVRLRQWLGDIIQKDA